MSVEVKELRFTERYIALEPLQGSFGVASVFILNLAEHGVQVEHAQPLRIATRGRLWFKRDDIVVSAPGIVVWSHLSKQANEKGKLLYHSGIHVADASAAFLGAVEALVVRGVIKADPQSLDRKRIRLLRKQQARFGRPNPRPLQAHEKIPADQAVLVRHARDLLKNNAEEAQQWYERAKATIAQLNPALAATMIHHRDDALAIWEFLDRTVDLTVITRVLDAKN